MTDSPLDQLTAEWDHAQAEDSAAAAVLNNGDRAYREHNAQNATRLRSGAALMHANLKADAQSTRAAAKIARATIVAEMIELIRAERDAEQGVSMQTPEHGTGEEIVARIRERFDGRERTQEQGRARREGRAQYERDIEIREQHKRENLDGSFSVEGCPPDVLERLQRGEYGTAVPIGRMPEAGIVQPMPRPKVGPPVKDKQPPHELEPIEITDEQRAAWKQQARENAERRAAVLAGEHAPIAPPKVVTR
jgi:hypothetical protein